MKLLIQQMYLFDVIKMKQVKNHTKNANIRTNRVKGMYSMSKKQHEKLVKSAREVDF